MGNARGVPSERPCPCAGNRGLQPRPRRPAGGGAHLLRADPRAGARLSGRRLPHGDALSSRCGRPVPGSGEAHRHPVTVGCYAAPPSSAAPRQGMHLTGIHHLSAITATASANNRFYTQTLGLRRVKKTVNQDDTSAYHLFFADGVGSPGTDLTFFDWPVGRERRGTRSISRTGLRVDEASLDYWAARLRERDLAVGEIDMIDGRAGLDFEDAEGQRFRLTA